MRNSIVISFIAIAVLLAPAPLLACPVCFGASDSPTAAGVNMAIWAMLIVTLCVLSGFAAFIIYLWRRASLNIGPTALGATTTPAKTPGGNC